MRSRRSVDGGEASGYVTTDEDALDGFPGFPDVDEPDTFAALNAAFHRPVVITIPAGTVLPQPIVVDHHVDRRGDVPAARRRGRRGLRGHRRRALSRRPTTSCWPCRSCRSRRARRRGSSTSPSTTCPTRRGRSVICRRAARRDSSVTLATVALGGHYARLRTEARITGRGGSTKQLALYFADGEQMHDFRTIQDHAAPHTTSDLLFKGAVQDSSASVYTGLIKIRPDAGGSVAFQTNRNLTLGAGAWAESVPNLEIETNDVRCSHASTVGPIDDEQRFYIESRGVPTPVAERLIVLGFFDEVLAQLPMPALTAELRQRVATKFDSRRVAVGAERGGDAAAVRARAGVARRVMVGDVPVALVRIDDDVYAIGDICSHAEVSLSGGEVYCDEKEIECPQHGSVFSLETGEPATLPATQPVPVLRRDRVATASSRCGVEQARATDDGDLGDPWAARRRGRDGDPARHRPDGAERRRCTP